MSNVFLKLLTINVTTECDVIQKIEFIGCKNGGGAGKYFS
jgi:hypothetical protein